MLKKQYSILITIIVVLCLGFPLFADQWYGTYAYRKPVELPRAASADQSNFPVLICLSNDTGLKTKTAVTAFDILFTDIQGTKLDHEIEYFDRSDGILYAWVRLPFFSSVSAASNVIFVYYDLSPGGG